MPIFENNGKKQNVQDAHVEKYMELYPDATTVMERDGKKYRVKAKDYNTFLGDTLEAPKMESAPHTVTAPQVETEPQQGFLGKVKGGIADVARVTMEDANFRKRVNNAEVDENAVEAALPQATARMSAQLQQGATMKGAFDRAYATTKHNELYKSLEEQLSAAEGNLQKLEQEFIAKEDAVREAESKLPKLERMGRMMSRSGMPGATANFDTFNGRLTDPEWRMLNTANRIIGETKELIDAAKNDRGMWTGIGRTLADIDTWTSLMEGLDAKAIADVADVDLEKATPAQLALLDALAMRVAVEQQYGGDVSSWYRAGETIGNMVPLAIEMGLNPAGGAGRKAAQAMLKKVATKGTKGLAKRIGQRAAIKGAGYIGSMAGGAAMSSTTSLPGIAVRAKMNSIGDAQYDVDQYGNVGFAGFKPGESYGKEFLKEFGRTTFEHATEQMGAEWLSKLIGKPLGWIGKGAMKIPGVESVTGKVGDWLDNKVGDALKKLAKDVNYQGPIEEFGEEFVSALHAASIDGMDSLKKWFEGDNLETTAIAVTMPALLGLGASVTYGAVDYKRGAKAKNKQMQAYKEGFEAFADMPEDWKTIVINLNSPSGIIDEMKRIYNDPIYTDKQKIAALTYGARTMAWMGTEGIKGVNTDENVRMLNEMLGARYREGYEQEPTGVNAVKEANEYTNARNEVVKVLSLAEGADVDAMLEGRTAEEIAMGDSEVEDAVNNYIKARARRDGFRERYQEERDRQFAESDRSVDETANDGMVYTTTTPSGEKIIITGGKVVLDNEGYIDVNQSEGLVAMFPDGSRKPVRPGDLREKVEVSNAEEMKAARRASIEERWRAEFESAENAYVEQQKRAEGVVFDVTDKEGTHRVEVVKEGDEMSNILVDGEQMQISTEMLNALREEAGVTQTEKVEGENEVAPVGEVAAPVVQAPKTALEQIPRNEKNVPLYEQVDSELAWDGVVEEAGGNEETAMLAVNSMIEDKKRALAAAEKAKAKAGATITEKIAAENERVANIEKAKADLAKWEEIAGVKAKRALAAEAESKRVADEAAAKQRAEEERLRAEREEAERAEREALNGVPDMVDDKPQDARARGYRRVNGHKVDRQEPVQGLMGKEIAVKFSDSSIPTGRVAVIEAEQLQPSHIQGQRNPLHFIDEAQPKERNDAASVLSARKIAENVRPEEITSSVTAYTGAPTVNTRGEAVQGNNRSAALRLMWENNPEQAAKYKQYLMDHAAEFGLNAEEIAAMKSPVLVNMLDVSDADAITLGQYVAQDTESGGTERIKPKNVMQKMGGDMRSFANKLLASNNEEASFAELVDANGVEVLKWMAQKGYITPTQYKSAFDSKGNLTAEVKNDLRDVMYQSIFKGGSTQLEEMFNALPAKAQKAILATAFRDYDSPSAERMNGEVQNSIRAYYALARDAAFANAKNYKEAKEAAMMWARQYQLDDASGESFLPSENFSNFAIELAVKFKGETQKTLQNLFNNMYDLIQGTKQASLFEEADNTPRTLKEAIKETFNIDYNGQPNSNSLAGGNKAGQPGRQGTAGSTATGERIEGGERPADSTGGTRGNGEVSSPEIPNNQNRDNVSPVEGAAEGGNAPGMKRIPTTLQEIDNAVVEETQAPVVESAPVEDNTPQSQSDSSPTLVEQHTPQATNEMQEADLENAEKGEKGQKAVEPVGETDSSILSQTSDQVGEKYVDPNELSELFIPRPMERNNANEIEPPRVRATNKDGKMRNYYVDMDIEVGEHNINGNETYPPLEMLYDEYGEKFLKEHNIDPAVLPAPGKYRLLGYNNLGFYIDFNGGEYFIPGYGVPGQVRQMIEQGNYRGLMADAMKVESAQKAEAPGQSGVQQNESGKQSLAEKVVATAKKKQQARYADHAKGIAEKLGVEVTVHNDESTVTNKDAMTAISEGGEVKGWYNPNTGEIALFLPAMESMRDVESTILHEAVSHYGIKHFLGKEEFDNFLDGVWDMMPASKRAEFLQYVGADMKNPSKAKMRQAADEYVAHIAEKMDLNELEKSVWQRFIDYVMDVLRKAGFKNLKQRDVEAVIRASYANLRQNSKADNKNVVYENDQNGQILCSIRTYDESGREKLRDFIEKRIEDGALTAEDGADIVRQMDEIYEMCVKYMDVYEPFGTWSDAKVAVDESGKPVFSVIKKNGEYGMNLDFSLVCKKRRTLDAVFDEMISRGIIGAYELGQVDIAKINAIIRRFGFETACRLCFVDSKRFRVAQVADDFCALYNELVEMSDAKLRKVVKGEKGNTVRKKAATLLLEHPENRVLLSRDNFMSANGFDNMKVNKGEIMKLYNMKKGTGGPKASSADVQYLNDVIDSSWTPEKAFAVGGVRLQSFSDYVPRMVFDYIQLVADLSAKGLPVHAYTKEPLFAKTFGMTGIKINLSLVPRVDADGVAPGLDKDGNYAWQEGETFPYEEAMALQSSPEYKNNCGTIAVGVSDEHILKMLGDENIRMVIPYHKSGLNAQVAKFNNIDRFTDYTNEQNTRTADGKSIDKKMMAGMPDFNVEVHENGDPRAAAQKYLDWCDKKGYLPKFDKFRDHPNYYKLLEDFTTIVTENGVDNVVPQMAVTMTFPNEMNSFGSLDGLIRQGLEEDAVLEGKRSAEVGKVVDAIQEEFDAERDGKVKGERGNEDVNPQDSESGIRFRKVTDPAKIAELEAGEKIKTYRAMALIDGKLYPPMSSKNDGVLREPSEIGVWEEAEENPGKAKEMNGKYYFTLTKDNGKSVRDVAYNPYLHSSTTMLNDQFKEAQSRDNLVVVEMEIPISELTSGYKADKAHDAVGTKDWKAGTIQGQLTGTREVVLSRWGKPVRIVPVEEVAENIKAIIDGEVEYMPTNVVTPQQRKALEDLGVKFIETNNSEIIQEGEHKGEQYSAVYGKKAKKKTKAEKTMFRKVTPEMDAEYMAAVENGDMETAERLVKEAAKLAMPDTKVVDEDGNPMVVYHGTTEDFNVFDKTKGRANMDIQGMFFSPWDLDAKGYGPNVRAFFLDITKPANESVGYEALKKFQGQNNAGVKAREYLVSLGYDGVNNEDQEFIAFDPNQIKSADAVTYDDNGNVIPLSERFNEEKEDIRFSKRMPDKDAPIKEHTRTWAERCQEENPKLWNEVVDALKVLPEWGNAVDADARAMELLESLCERENYSRVEKEMKTGIERANGVFEMAERISSWAKVKAALTSFWNWVQRNVFGTEPKNWEDFVDEVVGRYYGVSKAQRLQERIGSLARDVLNAVFKQSGIDIDLAEPVNVEQVAVVETESGELNQRSTPEGANQVQNGELETENGETENGSISSVGTEENGSQAASEPQARNRNMDREAWKKVFKIGGEKAYDLMYELHGGIVSRYPKEFLEYLKEKIGVADDVANVIDAAHQYLVYNFQKKRPDLFPKGEKAHDVMEVHELLATKGYSMLEHTMDNGKAIGVKMMYRDKFIPSGKTDTSYTPEGHHGRSVICYYGAPESRLAHQYVFTVTKDNATETPTAYELAADPSLMTPEWAKYLEKTGRKNEDGSYNLEGLAPNFEDPFSLSHLMIRVGKEGVHDVEIISRYNHGAFDASGEYRGIDGQPNATLGGDLDKLVAGLHDSLMEYKNLDPNDIVVSEGVKVANDGKVYRYSDISMGYFFGDGFYIDYEGNAHVIDKNKERMYGMTVITKDEIYNAPNHRGIPIHKVTFTNNGVEFYTGGEEVVEAREIEVKGEKKIVEKKVWKGDKKNSFKNGVLTTEETNSDMIDNMVYLLNPEGLTATDITSVNSNFLARVNDLKALDMPNLEYTGSYFAPYLATLRVFNAPKLKGVGDGFLMRAQGGFELNLPNLVTAGNSVLAYYGMAEGNYADNISLPNLGTVGDNFMVNAKAKHVDLPNLGVAGFGFMRNVAKGVEVNVPNLWHIADDFLGGGWAVKSLNAPMLRDLPVDFMMYNDRVKNDVMEQIEQSENKQADEQTQEGQVMFRRVVDRDGNLIGDGSWHMNYKVDEVALSYPYISYKVDESASTESVYVTYTNNDPKYPENERPKVTVRYSNHDSNAVNFGDQLRGEAVERNNGELLYRLGLKEREWIPAPSVPTQTVSKKDLENNTYEESELTERDIMLLPVGADIAEHKGKLIKGTNELILVDKVLANNNRGYYRYSNIPEVEQQRAKQLVREIVDPYAKEKREEETRFRFIGKKGAENLDKAEEATTRLDNLGVAREMETAGKDAKAIKLATGWERGADGKWRYETDDDFEFDMNANVAFGKRRPGIMRMYNRWRELLHKKNALAFEGEALPADEGAEFESLSSDFNGTKLHNSRTLKDYIDAPELFEAYPEVADIKVSIEALNENEKGSYSPIGNIIRLNNKLGKGEMKSTLNHEIQHAIQYIEGFAVGGNVSSAATYLNLPLRLQRAYEIVAQMDEPTVEKIYEYTKRKDISIPDKVVMQKLFFSIRDGMVSFDDVLEATKNPYGVYKRLAGEVESRNVQERMGMSPEERRNKLAEETEDVRREDQIFIEDALKSANEVAEEDIPVESVQTQPMTFKERIINATLATSAKNKENLALRSDALRMFGRDVANVLKLMGKQREYDKSTVDQLVKLAKMYFKDAQLLGGLTPYQVGRVMTRLNNAVGKRDITDDANELVNILVDAHNKELEKMLEKQAKTKAKKVNASGVEVIGKLDKEGQLLLEEYNAGKELDIERIDEKIIDLQNEAADASGNVEGESGEPDAERTREVAARLRGLELARQYREDILAKKDEIKGLEQELKDAEKDVKDGVMDRAAYKEFRRATERAIVESKLEMVDAYHGLIHGLGGDISSSAKRAKLFQQQQIDHVKEIQHNANSDLLGHPAEAQGETPDKWNSSVPRLFMSAMPTFQTMLKFFGEKAADGRGYLYERFIPQHTQASHNEYVGKTEAREKMRDKLTEIFGKKTSIEDFLDMSRKDGAVLEYQEGGEKKTIDLTRGQVLYLYMINKMADGQMKLSRMGITDVDVLKMAKELPEEFLRFADWVQEEFLTELREKYNKVHERMFGAPMAAIESYFPIKINKRSRGEKIEPGMNAEDKPSTVTGSVIKRTKNAVAIDLSADAMQVLLGHIDDMENWAAWAEFRRDVKSLLNYRHFQNQVKGMESLRYGSGEKLWKNFVDVANIAAGSFKPSSTAADRAVRNIAKGVVSSKIAFRYFTAVKQILSTPAFWSEVDFGKMMNAYLHQKEAWDWAMKNLPGFSKRWEGRASGNEILLESDADWKVWQNRAVQWLSKEGMRANAFIDALTVATGAKAVFETKYEMFKKAGYSEERAREKALNRAAEAYNESQQSSESAYLSPLQAEATFVSSVLTAYRNSPFGYNRKMATAIANLKKKIKKGFKQESIEYMTKQLMRDDLNEEQAKEYAKSTYRRSVARDAADVALYGFFLNYVWVLGPSLIYIIGGDDDEKKKELLLEAVLDGAMGGLGNLPAGETLTGAIKAIAEGDVSNFKLPQAVAMQDMETIADLMQTDPVRAAGEVLNILVAMGVGVNPQTFTDMFVALADTEDFSPREIAMLVLRLINAPNSKLELLEADEAMENYGANIEEITREYAEYQKSKRATLTGWLYSDEAGRKALERYEKRFKKILDERFETIVENTGEYDMWYENSDPQMKAKLAKLRQKFLEGDKETTMEKLDSIDVTKKVLFGSGYDEVNTVYYELSTAEDEDMAMMIDTKLKELQPMMDEYNKLRGDERKAYREENLEQIQFYNRLNTHKNNVNNLKGAMKKEPEEAQEKMEKIRKIRTKAIELINNYNE